MVFDFQSDQNGINGCYGKSKFNVSLGGGGGGGGGEGGEGGGTVGILANYIAVYEET